MADPANISPAHCVLLAVHLASDSNISALRNLTALHSKTLHPTLVLRILLSFLPECTDPQLYTPYLNELVHGDFDDDAAGGIDISPVKELSEVQARKRVRKLHLLPLAPSSIPPSISTDSLTLFLIHRAYLIDENAGLLTLLPQLFVPFLDHSNYLRIWLISTLLPLLRLNYEYYPQAESALALAEFERLEGLAGVDALLSQSKHEGQADHVARDLRSLVGPWMCGDDRRKRRKIETQSSIASADQEPGLETQDSGDASLTQGSGWEDVFEWLLSAARTDFPLIVRAVEDWDGPGDVDYGGYDDGGEYLEEETQRRLELRYAQVAVAACFANPDATAEALRGVHRILVRLSQLLQLDPPPNLPSGHTRLLSMNSKLPASHELSAATLLQNALLRADNPLTKPTEQNLALLEALLFSTCVLARLGHQASLRQVTELYLFGNQEQQTNELQNIIRSIMTRPKRDDQEWAQIRDDILWLWGWGVEQKLQEGAESSQALQGPGILGKVEKGTAELEILKLFLNGSSYHLAVEAYVEQPASQRPLPLAHVEKAVLDASLNFYDNASNGNRTRGGVKRASDVLQAFRNHFPTSPAFARVEALISATHALSFYSLTLHHGVLFQPVNIRAHRDPIFLLEKVLDQNPKSYTKLDDLTSIGRNFVAAGLTNRDHNGQVMDMTPEEQERQSRAAERRITGMAIEAALAEDDFETAYSYVLNRLTPPSPASSQALQPSPPTDQDDISWRAAFQAGRHRLGKSAHAATSAATTTTATSASLQRLQKRMDLLSQSLLIAPPAALSEILAAWRRCEEELSVLLAQESAEETSWDDRGANKKRASAIPGGFVGGGMMLQEDDYTSLARRGGRQFGHASKGEEAPMGLFDVARGAAAALSRSAFPLHGVAVSSTKETRAGGAGRGTRRTGAGPGFDITAQQQQQQHNRTASTASAGSDAGSFVAAEGGGRVRKRDVVSNMVTGGLASGLGWVLGATPVQSHQQEHEGGMDQRE
ncbi:MAG: hypothetical protein M1819_003867 [Sarea resinae]|nr:MAG: hypothetical protein M1819_003867 [Sarea resinae]